jgi:hypothetical protein
MTNRQCDNETPRETPEEKAARLRRQATERLKGFYKKASEVPRDRPKPKLRTPSPWDLIVGH